MVPGKVLQYHVSGPFELNEPVHNLDTLLIDRQVVLPLTHGREVDGFDVGIVLIDYLHNHVSVVYVGRIQGHRELRVNPFHGGEYPALPRKGLNGKDIVSLHPADEPQGLLPAPCPMPSGVLLYWGE